MAPNTRPRSILESLGEEIIRIITPVSICMLMVVILVSILSADSSSSSATISSMATIAYSESDSDSFWDKLKGAILNSLVFVAAVTFITFLLVLLFYLRCTKFLKFYMGFSAFIVLGFLGGEIAVFLIEQFNIRIDCITFLVVLFNFAVVGVLAVFMSKIAILVTQGYLVLIGMLVAYWFTLLPEWTTWVLLVAMALYDLVAVLLPFGPLRLLVELAISRDEDIPALVYEARPVGPHGSGLRRRVWRDTRGENTNDGSNFDSTRNSVLPVNMNSESNSSINQSDASDHNLNPGSNSNNDDSASSLVILEEGRVTDHSESTFNSTRNPVLSGNMNPASNFSVNSSDTLDTNLNPGSNSQGGNSALSLVRVEEGRVSEKDGELLAPLIDHRLNVDSHGEENDAPSESLMQEGIGLGSSGAIKLGLGDFVFYSVLVGRAAMYDFMTVYACYLAIIAGLGITLMLLALYQKALPALPVSIALGVMFYFLTRLLLEVFVVQCSLNLLMF